MQQGHLDLDGDSQKGHDLYYPVIWRILEFFSSSFQPVHLQMVLCWTASHLCFCCGFFPTPALHFFQPRYTKPWWYRAILFLPQFPDASNVNGRRRRYISTKPMRCHGMARIHPWSAAQAQVHGAFSVRNRWNPTKVKRPQELQWNFWKKCGASFGRMFSHNSFWRRFSRTWCL